MAGLVKSSLKKTTGNGSAFSATSAGGQMVERVPTAGKGETAREVLQKLARQTWETISWVYILGRGRKLLGVVSIQKLLAAQIQDRMASLMVHPPITVEPQVDQSKVAILAIEHDLKALPVVSEKGQFLGVIPADHIIDILHQEHLEDFLKATGIHGRGRNIIEIVRERVLGLVAIRLPWLLIGLLGGILATSIVRIFEASLKEEISLAFFIPVIAYMSDAIGTQTETLLIRSIAQVKVNIPRYLAREVLVGALIGLVCGSLAYLFAFFWLGLPQVAVVVGFSLFLTMSVATALAVIIPSLLVLSGRDPAIGSGPFTTALQDIVSLLIYFTVAVLIL